MIYSDLIEEYKTLRGKLSLLTDAEHEAAMMRLKEMDNVLKDFERSIPRCTGGSTNYNNALANNIMQEIEINAISTDLIIKSRWASWLPFGWMHSLAASYYARKARRIYNSKRLADQIMKLNGVAYK